MADYGKKKNDELIALCKERGLAHSGKKADLVKRLEEHDAQASTDAKSNGANEDEIDWDEEPATDATKSATTESTSAPGKVEPEVATETTTSDTPAKPEKAEESRSTEADAAALAKEIEKRKARARRFGLPEDSDEIKKLERAQKFGAANLLDGLNKELTTDRKRRRPDGEADSNKKAKGRPGPGKALEKKTEIQPQAKKEAPTPAAKGKVEESKKKPETKDGYPAWMTAEDKERAEKRKARFAKPDA